jgi:hypothetical protein
MKNLTIFLVGASLTAALVPASVMWVVSSTDFKGELTLSLELKQLYLTVNTR